MDERSTLGMSSKDLVKHWITEALVCLETGCSSSTLNRLKKLLFEDNHPLLAPLKENWPVVLSTGDNEQQELPVDLNEGGGFPKTGNLKKLQDSLDDHEARNPTHQPKMDSNNPQDDHEQQALPVDLNEGGGFPKTENLKKLQDSLHDHEARNPTHQPEMNSNYSQVDHEQQALPVNLNEGGGFPKTENLKKLQDSLHDHEARNPTHQPEMNSNYSQVDHEQKALPIDLSEGGGFPKMENLKKLQDNLDDHEARNPTHQPKMDSNSPQDDEEMTDIAIKKAAFLRSRRMRDQDSLVAADSMGVNLCAKCSEGGELLVCSSGGCQVQVHRSCLVSTTTHDQIVNFCCPFCTYSQIVEARREAERKEELARKEWMSFIGNDSTTELVEELQQKLVEVAGKKVGQEECNSPTEEQFSDGMEGKEKSLVEGEAKPITSCDSARVQEKETQDTSPAVLNGRRNKRSWTEMEVKKLEVGVSKFWNGDGEIPWKQILEFGKDVFNRRTTINLKDKWRNIQIRKAKTQSEEKRKKAKT